MYDSHFNFENAMFYSLKYWEICFEGWGHVSDRFWVDQCYNILVLNWPGITWELCASWQSSDPGMTYALLEQYISSILAISWPMSVVLSITLGFPACSPICTFSFMHSWQASLYRKALHGRWSTIQYQMVGQAIFPNKRG